MLDVLALGVDGDVEGLWPLGAGAASPIESDAPEPPADGVGGAIIVAALDDQQHLVVQAYGGCLAVVVPVEAQQVAAGRGEDVGELVEDRVAVESNVDAAAAASLVEHRVGRRELELE
ncbi:MAG: hypothetical protein ACRDLN_00675 [Solirubrobacteraceae bacterium]